MFCPVGAFCRYQPTNEIFLCEAHGFEHRFLVRSVARQATCDEGSMANGRGYVLSLGSNCQMSGWYSIYDKTWKISFIANYYCLTLKHLSRCGHPICHCRLTELFELVLPVERCGVYNPAIAVLTTIPLGYVVSQNWRLFEFSGVLGSCNQVHRESPRG